MFDVRNKRVTVIGLGKSGLAACKLLVASGARVTASDAKARSAVDPEILALEPLGIELALGSGPNLEAAELVVLSPGVPQLEEVARASRRGVPVWGEVELAVRATMAAAERAGRPRPRLIAVGGTNGKSTTTSLIGALAEAKGLKTFVGGNLGEPLAAHTNEAFDVIVLEVSSFQMERVDTFHPDVAVLLNVTPDHLDRYPDFEGYAAAKGNAFVNQGPHDLAVIPASDATCAAQARRGRGKVMTFGPGGEVDVTSDAILWADKALSVSRANVRLEGGHNALNVAAALAAVAPLELSEEQVRGVLATFEGLAHRMALVAEVDGVRYYDDSKGTNVGASVTAVRGVVEPKVVLIAGGRDKGGSYEPLACAMRERGRAIVVMGEAKDLIAGAVGDSLPVRSASSMVEAVELAKDLAQRGDAVLLSPACSSFDMFRDYKERGDAFVRAVTDLTSRKGLG